MNINFNQSYGLRGKTIIFCLPGAKYSGNFLVNFVELITFLSKEGAICRISQTYSSMVNFARCKCLNADVNRGKNQKPFNGEHYDYLMWIDSDIIFNINSFLELIKMDKDIASGWYSQPSGSLSKGSFTTPVVENMNDEYFKKHGFYQFLSAKEIKDKKEKFKVDYIGFGWVLIKQGVFEKIKYPWFAPKFMKLNDNIEDVCSEDVSFCIDAKKENFDIWVNPKAHVGHEKTLVI